MMTRQCVALLSLALVAVLSGSPLHAQCTPPGVPLGNSTATNAIQHRLTGFTAWNGSDGTSVTFWWIGQTEPGRSNFNAFTMDCSTPGGFVTGPCTGLAVNEAWYIDDWSNPGVGGGCPPADSSTTGCSAGSAFNAWIFETVSNSANPSHSCSFVAASASYNKDTGFYDLDCREVLHQVAILAPAFVSKDDQGLSVTMKVPEIADCNIAPGSPGLSACKWQMYRSASLGTNPDAAVLPGNSGPWTPFGTASATGGTVTATVPEPGVYVFVLRPTFDDNHFTTTNVGANSEAISVGAR